MEKSELSGRGLRGKRKESDTPKANEIFYVANLSKNVGLKDFDLELKVSLPAAVKLSKKKGKLTLEDIPQIQLSN